VLTIWIFSRREKIEMVSACMSSFAKLVDSLLAKHKKSRFWRLAESGWSFQNSGSEWRVGYTILYRRASLTNR